MSDTPQAASPQPARDEQPRDTMTGRYVRRHAASDDTPPAQSAPPAPPSPPGPPAPPGEKDPEQKEGRKRWLLLLLLLLILLLLLCAGVSYFTWWRKQKPITAQPTPTAAATATATSTAAGPAPGSPSPTATRTASPSPSPSPAARLVTMPNVVGMPAADAKAVLESAGLTNIKFVNEGGEELSILASRSVTKQSVAAGTQVQADAAIVITTRTTSNGKG